VTGVKFVLVRIEHKESIEIFTPQYSTNFKNIVFLCS
jgi:hypothetical protein